MALWTAWWNAIWLLRPAFSRLRTFLWFATAVAGFTVRTELLGIGRPREARHGPRVSRYCRSTNARLRSVSGLSPSLVGSAWSMRLGTRKAERCQGSVQGGT